MEQIINLRQAEYNDVATEYVNLHERTMDSIRTIISKYREGITKEGCFFADSTSEMLSGMLDIFEAEILSLLDESFSLGECGISTMIDIMTVTDTAC